MELSISAWSKLNLSSQKLGLARSKNPFLILVRLGRDNYLRQSKYLVLYLAHGEAIPRANVQ
jgi:hypothetical protein